MPPAENIGRLRVPWRVIPELSVFWPWPASSGPSRPRMYTRHEFRRRASSSRTRPWHKNHEASARLPIPMCFLIPNPRVKMPETGTCTSSCVDVCRRVLGRLTRKSLSGALPPPVPPFPEGGLRGGVAIEAFHCLLPFMPVGWGSGPRPCHGCRGYIWQSVYK